MSVDRESCFNMISLARLIVLDHAAVACSAFHFYCRGVVKDDARAHVAFVVKELDVQLSVVVLRRLHVKFDGQFFCGRYHFLHLGIVIRVFVAHFQPFAVKFNGSPKRGIDVPVSHVCQFGISAEAA